MSADVLVAGVSGARQNAAVGLTVNGRPVACCEQERITRVRHVGLPDGRLPAEALDTVLRSSSGRRVGDIQQFVVAEDAIRLPSSLPVVRLDHARAHAATAFYLSGLRSSAVLICDGHGSDATTAWIGSEDGLSRLDVFDGPMNLAALYREGAALFGFAPAQVHELEALARLDAGAGAERFRHAIGYEDGRLVVSTDWPAIVTAWLAGARPADLLQRAHVASAFQRHLGELLLAILRDVRRHSASSAVCLGGGLFFNTYFTTLAAGSGVFDEVFVAPNPGNAGLAIGMLLDPDVQSAATPSHVSPFLGPEFAVEDIKATLDNCKLSYEYLDEESLIGLTVEALTAGQLVGWFQGRMEWTHRALGHRSILASPCSPYVLDNLNLYLKRRPRHRTYGVSVPLAPAATLFEGPPASRFMEYEYRPRSADTLRHVMPSGTGTLRVQTVHPGDDETGRFDRLHRAFGEATGTPVLVNTSFNGFLEPMVASPRDAVRVFFGSGLDLLVMDRFVVRK